MKERFLTSFLLIGMIAGCTNTTSSTSLSSKQDSSNESTNSVVSTTLSSSTSSSSSVSSSSSSISELIELPDQATYDAPTSGYALLVTPGNGGQDYYFSLNYIEEKDGQGRDQYYGDNIPLFEGDVFKLYDGTNSTPWVEKALESYGQYLSFEVTDLGIKCLNTALYDIYAKFAWEDNTIYIGNQEGA